MSKLPDCMMPDGGNACIGYREAKDLIAELEAELAAAPQKERERLAMIARKSCKKFPCTQNDNTSLVYGHISVGEILAGKLLD